MKKINMSNSSQTAMKSIKLLTLFTLMTFNLFAGDPPSIEGGIPDTILIELDDSTQIMIMTNNKGDFSSLNLLGLDTIIYQISKSMESKNWDLLSDSLFEIELRDLEHQLAKQEHILYMEQEMLDDVDLAMDILANLPDLEDLPELEHLKSLKKLEALHELEELEKIKIIEEIYHLKNDELLEELEHKYEHERALKEYEHEREMEREMEYEMEREEDYDDKSHDEIVLSSTVGIGLIRDKLSPNVGLNLGVNIKRYYLGASIDAYTTFEDEFDPKGTVFVGICGGYRYGDLLNSRSLQDGYHRWGLYYLTSSSGNYFKKNTFKVTYAFNRGPIQIIPEFILTNNFKLLWPGFTIKAYIF